VEEVEPSSVDKHGLRGALPVTGAAQASAEETAGVELACKAEGAIAAKSEALVALGARGGRGRSRESAVRMRARTRAAT
jgi:hypothetical protein